MSLSLLRHAYDGRRETSAAGWSTALEALSCHGRTVGMTTNQQVAESVALASLPIPITPEDLLAKATPGTPVTYHGSLAEHHGPATVVGPCYCRRCHATGGDWSRMELQLPDGGPLLHVQRSSYSLEVPR